MSVWVVKTRPAAAFSTAHQAEALRARRAAGPAPTAATLERQLWLARAMPIVLDVWADTRSGIPLAHARIVDVHIAHRPIPVELGTGRGSGRAHPSPRLFAMAIHAVGSHVVEVRFDSRARLDQGAQAAHTLHIAFRAENGEPAHEEVPGPAVVRFRVGPHPAGR